jgi:hypothetical protein
MADEFGRSPHSFDADHRAALSEFDPDAGPLDVLEPKDYMLSEPTAVSEFREKVDDLQFQIGVLKARVAAIGSESIRLGRATTSWVDRSAHSQLGSYPWLKLAGAFTSTFLATRLVRTLPLGPLASVAVPLVLRQVQPNARRR